MNFTIKKEKLLNILQLADKAISPFTPNPELKNIFITINKDSLIFITSDTHISINCLFLLISLFLYMNS